MSGIGYGLVLYLFAATAAAGQPTTDLTTRLPAAGEVAGLTLSEEPQVYRGDDLYQLIDGGAEIYHEYGFAQVLSAEYVDQRGTAIHLDIYQMKSAAAAYGIYSFKVGGDGRALDIGQEALLEDYYLNFWKGEFQISVSGWDAGAETLRGVVALAKAVDARISETGEPPGLAHLLLREPLAFSRAKYVRGPLGVMNHTIFGAGNIFRVRQGMVGTIGDCRVVVFRYEDEEESAEVYREATAELSRSPRFNDGLQDGKPYSTTYLKDDLVVIDHEGRYIAVVIGNDREKVKDTLLKLVGKLRGPNGKPDHPG